MKQRAILLLSACFLFWVASACDDDPSGPPEDVEAEAPEVPEITFSGLVLAEGTDAPVADVIVTVSPVDGGETLTATTGADGVWELTGDFTGTYSLLATRDGFHEANAVAEVDQSTDPPTADVPTLFVQEVETESAEVTPEEGGTVTASAEEEAGEGEPEEETTATVTAPAGAVSGNVTLTVAAIPAGKQPTATGDTEVVAPTGGVILGPDGTEFSEPITITFGKSEAAASGLPVRVRQFLPETRQWVPARLLDDSPVPVSVGDEGEISFQLDHFSTYQVSLSFLNGTVTVVSPIPGQANTTRFVRARTSEDFTVHGTPAYTSSAQLSRGTLRSLLETIRKNMIAANTLPDLPDVQRVLGAPNAQSLSTGATEIEVRRRDRQTGNITTVTTASPQGNDRPVGVPHSCSGSWAFVFPVETRSYRITNGTDRVDVTNFQILGDVASEGGWEFADLQCPTGVTVGG